MTLPRRIGFVQSASCSVCLVDNTCCAVFETPERAPFRVCRNCLGEAYSLSLSAPRGAKRPHRKPCACADCGAFDRGATPDALETAQRAAELGREVHGRFARLELDGISGDSQEAKTG